MLVTGRNVRSLAGFLIIFRDANRGRRQLRRGYHLYRYLKGAAFNLGVLVNATGAARVQKLGTGHNMPTVDEIKLVLDRFGYNDLTTLSKVVVFPIVSSYIHLEE